MYDACDLPRPVARDSKSNVSTYSELDWVYRVREELDEALAAETWAEKGEEIADAITVCVSWLESLGFTEHARIELFRKVNAKNQARGYMEGKT